MSSDSDIVSFEVDNLLSYLRIPRRFLDHCLDELNVSGSIDPENRIKLSMLDLKCIFIHSGIYRMIDACEGFAAGRVWGYPADAPCQCFHWKEVFASGGNPLKEIDAYIKTWRRIAPTIQEQEKLRAVLRTLLKRAPVDADFIFPCPEKDFLDSPMFISIQPGIRGGEPVILTTRIPASGIFGQFLAGDSIEYLAEDFGLEPHLIEECIRFGINLRREPVG